jgi:excisionase family DNA binding protein
MTGKQGDGMEPYMTIRELAEVLRLSEQTIQRYVLNKHIPYLKIRKVIRFRPADIEQWAENGGLVHAAGKAGNVAGDLFTGLEAEETGTEGTETAANDGGNTGDTETGEVTA